MNSGLRDAIVRISVGSSRGTGFVVRLDQQEGVDSRYASKAQILTALHVVADPKKSEAANKPVWHAQNVEIQFSGGEKIVCSLDNATGSLADNSGPARSRWNIGQDWVLVSVEGAIVSCTGPIRLARLEKRRWSRSWSTFGFTDAQPDSGEPHSGKIELDEASVIHLFDRQAAAGKGGLLSGCSGAPCVFEGHAVGLILEALQNQKGESIHGAVFALPVQVIAEQCQLPLSPGPSVLAAEIEAELSDVPGSKLEGLARDLGLPEIDSESALRIWIAKALLIADEALFRRALVNCANNVRDPVDVAEMVLSGSLLEEAVARVNSCFHHGAPKGIGVIATKQLTVWLLVARALGYQRARNHFAFVDSRESSANAWSQRIRGALAGLLKYSLEELDDGVNLHEALEKWGVAILAVPFDEHALAEIERYQRARPLAMLSLENAPAFVREGYELARVVADSSSENKLFEARQTAARYLTSPNNQRR